jgi:hypothetical protein
LDELCPDQGGYLAKCPSFLPPWKLSAKMGGIDPCMLSCWACLCHQIISNGCFGMSPEELVKFIETHGPAICDEARAFRLANIVAGIPISPHPYILMKIFCSKIIGGRPQAKAKAAQPPVPQSLPAKSKASARSPGGCGSERSPGGSAPERDASPGRPRKAARQGTIDLDSINSASDSDEQDPRWENNLPAVASDEDSSGRFCREPARQLLSSRLPSEMPEAEMPEAKMPAATKPRAPRQPRAKGNRKVSPKEKGNRKVLPKEKAKAKAKARSPEQLRIRRRKKGPR